MNTSYLKKNVYIYIEFNISTYIKRIIENTMFLGKDSVCFVIFQTG